MSDLFANQILQYYRQLQPPANLPDGVEVLNPFHDPSTFELASRFYNSFYGDRHERFICFGINPGRFGAGVTGVPFTDPIRLAESCGISNQLDKRPELSSRFIYEMITAYGTPERFYRTYYISAVSPLGYVRNGINLNYYDLPGYKSAFEAYVCTQIEAQLLFPINRNTAFSIGKGKNIDYLNYINRRHGYFDQIIPLPHPRWVMQYRLKKKGEYIQEYLDAFARAETTKA